MPPRLPRSTCASQSRIKFSNRGRSAVDLFFCPSCSHWRLYTPNSGVNGTHEVRLWRGTPSIRISTAKRSVTSLSHHVRQDLKPRFILNGARNLSSTCSVRTLVSQTAINPPTNIPSSYAPLHSALGTLEESARDYVNISRLQLALRGLESTEPVVRIAVSGLGNDGLMAAKRLVRVLCADPLSEKRDWEAALSENATEDGTTLLVRYGNESDTTLRGPLFSTLSVPSHLLQRLNIELLITTLNIGAGAIRESAEDVRDAILVPSLQTPISSTGRTGFVTYPVHRALVYGEGVEACVAYGQLAPLLEQAAPQEGEEGMIKTALSLPGQTANELSRESGAANVRFAIVDESLASKAIGTLRASSSNSSSFSHLWQASGVSDIVDWLTASSKGNTSPESLSESGQPNLKPAIHDLITSLLSSISASISAEQTRRTSQLVNSEIPETTRQNLERSITNWSAAAHSDLRASLDAAFASPTWRRTSWWRLLWRVDDVGMAASDVLIRHFLFDAERGMIYLTGHLSALGFLKGRGGSTGLNPMTTQFTYGNDPSTSSVAQGSASATGFDPISLSETLDHSELKARIIASSGIDVSSPRPWPLSIQYARARLLYTFVPSLQARAQTLLLQYLSTTAVTSALAGWTYVALTGVGVYEAGAVATLGLVWSLRRLQRKWEDARSVFEGDVREEGRVVLRDLESGLRDIVETGERRELAEEDVRAWEAARRSVEGVRAELEKLKRGVTR
ncbi:hypothetical protein LTR28_011024 [Elasticomyces elasticus]|nr:hypothetical protein LTR28_011024 [Elasticomyces elasticus]